MKKLIVVTGGTKGIGRAIVIKFASEGFDVITCARNAKDLKAFEKQVNGEKKGTLATFKADLSKRKELDLFVDFVNSKSKKVDILVNNTGVFLPGKVHEEKEGVLEQLIHTNLYSAYYLTRGLIKAMIKNKSGHIFNICSTASIMPYINGGSYCISKYALYGMTKVLREEMKEHQVRVTAVLPGATFTSSWEGANLPEDRFIKSEDIAEAIFGAYALSKNAVLEELLIRPQLGDI